MVVDGARRDWPRPDRRLVERRGVGCYGSGNNGRGVASRSLSARSRTEECLADATSPRLWRSVASRAESDPRLLLVFTTARLRSWGLPRTKVSSSAGPAAPPKLEVVAVATAWRLALPPAVRTTRRSSKAEGPRSIREAVASLFEGKKRRASRRTRAGEEQGLRGFSRWGRRGGARTSAC